MNFQHHYSSLTDPTHVNSNAHYSISILYSCVFKYHQVCFELTWSHSSPLGISSKTALHSSRTIPLKSILFTCMERKTQLTTLWENIWRIILKCRASDVAPSRSGLQCRVPLSLQDCPPERLRCENAHVVSSQQDAGQHYRPSGSAPYQCWAVGDYSLEPASCLNILVSSNKQDLCTCERQSCMSRSVSK